jgi:hypothetical protein
MEITRGLKTNSFDGPVAVRVKVHRNSEISENTPRAAVSMGHRHPGDKRNRFMSITKSCDWQVFDGDKKKLCERVLVVGNLFKQISFAHFETFPNLIVP